MRKMLSQVPTAFRVFRGKKKKKFSKNISGKRGFLPLIPISSEYHFRGSHERLRGPDQIRPLPGLSTTDMCLVFKKIPVMAFFPSQPTTSEEADPEEGERTVPGKITTQTYFISIVEKRQNERISPASSPLQIPGIETTI